MNVTLKKILCPVDFSATSDLALHYAVAFARQNNASLTLIHVVAPPIAAVPGEAGLLNVPQADIQEITSACRTRIESTARELQQEPLEIDTVVLSGVPFIEISRYASAHEIDMIVIGSRGRSGLSHLLLGSVAERVLRKAPCLVLVVKEKCKRLLDCAAAPCEEECN